MRNLNFLYENRNSLYLSSIITQTILSSQCRHIWKSVTKLPVHGGCTPWHFIHGISVFIVSIKIRGILRGLKEVNVWEIYLILGLKCLIPSTVLQTLFQPYIILFSEKHKKPLRWYWSGTNFLYDLRCVKKYCFWTANEYFYLHKYWFWSRDIR